MSDASQPRDYRESHQAKGGHYDQEIFGSPLDAYMDRWEAHHLAAAIKRLFPDKIPRYLDFACGTGRITQRVEPHAREAVGVDVSESMLGVARTKCHSTRFVCADLTQGASELGTFDLVTSFRFFGNAQDDLRDAALGALSARTRSGGYLIINNHRNPYAPLELVTRLGPNPMPPGLTHGRVKELFAKHGFAIDEQRPIGTWLLRHKMTTADLLESDRADFLERLFQHSMFVPVAPDALLVARKR